MDYEITAEALKGEGEVMAKIFTTLVLSPPQQWTTNVISITKKGGPQPHD